MISSVPIWYCLKHKMTQPNFQYIAQEDEMACGLAALAMVIAHYGTSPALSRLRQLTQTNALGTTAYGLLSAAQTLHFDTLALQADQTLLTQPDLLLPFIAHVRQLTGDYHYVVVYGRAGQDLCMADPDPAVGKIKLSLSAFSRMWTGVALFITPPSAST